MRHPMVLLCSGVAGCQNSSYAPPRSAVTWASAANHVPAWVGSVSARDTRSLHLPVVGVASDGEVLPGRLVVPVMSACGRQLGSGGLAAVRAAGSVPGAG
jgi:hypothetical protein